MLELALSRDKDFLETAISAIANSGHTVRLAQTAKLPFQLQFQDENQLFDVLVYLWRLTFYSKNQYEIRIRVVKRVG